MSPTNVNRQSLIEIAKRHRLVYLAMFGSYARATATAQSDVDLYARFGRPVSLFQVLDLQHEMEDALGLNVDLIVEEAVIPYQFVREQMMNELVVLYEDQNPVYAAAQ